MLRMLLLAVVGLVLGAGSAAAELPAEVAAPYLHIQATLAADSTGGVAEAAQSIVAAAGDLGDAGAAILMAANAVSLADDLVIIAHGRIAAMGTPMELADRFGNRDLEEIFVSAIGGEPS